VAAVNKLDPGPDAILVSGDLANTPLTSEYELFRDLTEPLMAPAHVIGGNHDDLALVHEHFPIEGGAGEGDYRWTAEVGDLRLVACDSNVAGSDAGAFGPERLAWLESLLDEDVETPTIVAMHHPPVDIGIDALDEIRIPDPDASALAQSLSLRPHVVRLVCGHVHRAATALLPGACPVFTCPSIYMAAPLEIGVGGEPSTLVLVPEPPAFAIHALLLGGGLVSHVQPVV
jgi:Icc protein